MAIQPNSLTTRERLQPGAQGEIFEADLPGYRGQGDRINRTQNRLACSPHDVLNIKYMFDYRLVSLFRYGYAYGYNQVVIPKGRIVSTDPHMDLVDFDMKSQCNTLTIANGGAPVRLRQTGDLYKAGGAATGLVDAAHKGQALAGIGKEWTPLIGMESAYDDKCYRPFVTAGPQKQLTDAGYSVDATSGKIVDGTGAAVDTVRPGNTPLGMLQRNEYTRGDDAYNGMMPGPVVTDMLVELPWFAYKNKAEQNPWGAAYGSLFPGCLVKSDENGRFTISPLSYEAEVATMTISEYELERQQVIGQIYAVSNSLLPEGSAKWATWALEDRLNFEDFNPTVWPQTNRKGEDAVNNSPFVSDGKYPGYPYDKAYKDSDLHMLESAGRMGNYDPRMDPQYQVDNLGIPGLTDGANAVVRDYPQYVAGQMHSANGADYVDFYYRTSEIHLEPGSLQIAVVAAGGTPALAPCVQDAMIDVGGDATWLKVTYANEHQGIIRLSVIDKAKADAALAAGPLNVYLKFQKRGLAGVPTFMDWDGCVGSVKILLQK